MTKVFISNTAAKKADSKVQAATQAQVFLLATSVLYYRYRPKKHKLRAKVYHEQLMIRFSNLVEMAAQQFRFTLTVEIVELNWQ